jgi:peptidoglycan/xylan/chitin deacetylase (PgdA/CDA1 family)
MMKSLQIMTLSFLIFNLAFFPGVMDWGHGQEKGEKERIVSEFTGKVPKQWGVTVRGVKTRLNTDQKVIALTLDACGGPRSSGYDRRLVEYLKAEKIPATLFASGKWMDANLDIFLELARNPLFEIENHGLNHKPCSVNGRSAYGMKGTKSVDEVFTEIEGNSRRIESLTGRKPKCYRPAASTCDEICVEIAGLLGYEVVSFSVLGDAGATYSKRQVKEALLKASPSSIVLMHMNHPEGETAEGVMEAIPELRKKGFRFVKLSECDLR